MKGGIKTMREYQTTSQLGKLLGITGDAVKRRIYKGKYTMVKRESGRGGQIWLVSVYDPEIPQDIRNLYEGQVGNLLGFPCRLNMRSVMGKLEEIAENAQQIILYLKALGDKLK